MSLVRTALPLGFSSETTDGVCLCEYAVRFYIVCFKIQLVYNKAVILAPFPSEI